MKKKLVRFSSVYNPDEYDRKPLPDEIYNSEGATLARRGQALSRERLFNCYVLVDDVFVVKDIPPGAEGMPGPITRQEPDTPAPSSVRPGTPDSPPGAELADAYEEETADQIENYLVDLEFEPIPKIKTALRGNIHSLKEIFRKKIVNNMVFLASPNNERISRQIAEYLHHILDVSLLASDYLDMVTAIRNERNYVTFSHALGVAFYTMAIAKKLKMLRDDLMNGNMGRWLPVKTRSHTKPGSPVPFSNQLLKHIDGQKNSILIKYEPEVRDVLFDRLHDLMYEYAALKPGAGHPSLSVNYDDATLITLAMAAINIDIGKLCIPNRIINKAGPLSDGEWETVRNHPALSIAKLKEVNVNLPRMFVHIIGHHILDMNTGYPSVKVTIPAETKIITLADIYDAMTSPRFYGKAHTGAEAIHHMGELRDRGLIDLPLYLAAVHTFDEFNHEFVRRRRSTISGTEALDDEE